MTREFKTCLIKLILIYFRSTRFVVNDHFPLVWAEQNCLVMIMETEGAESTESWDHPLLIDTNYRMRHSRTFFNEIFLFNGGLSDCAGVITRPKDPWMQWKKCNVYFLAFSLKIQFLQSSIVQATMTWNLRCMQIFQRTF